MKANLFKYLMMIAVLFSAACGSKEEATEEATEETVAVVEESEDGKQVGVQIYSVRQALGEDFEGTVQKVADIGYDYIEAFGLGTDGTIIGMDPADYKKVVSDAGMEIHSVHASYFTPDQAETMIEAAKKLGVKYVIVPWINDDLREDYVAVAQNLNACGEKFKGTGIKLGYHNHAFEFEEIDGKYPLEILIENTDPENVMFQADLYWVTKGGADAVEFVSKYPGRFCSYHVKDATEGDLEQTTVGTGVVDFASVFAIDESGMEYFFVEDEREDDPMGNITAAYEYLSTAEFVD